MVMTSGTQSIRRACRMMKRATNRILKTKNHKVRKSFISKEKMVLIIM
jgi:hypothetical protein